MDCGRNSGVNIRPFFQRTLLTEVTLFIACQGKYTIAASSNLETANRFKFLPPPDKSALVQVSNRMSHGQFENMIIYCTTGAVLAGALAPLAEAPLPLGALIPICTSNSHTVCFTLRYNVTHCGICTH